MKLRLLVWILFLVSMGGVRGVELEKGERVYFLTDVGEGVEVFLLEYVFEEKQLYPQRVMWFKALEKELIHSGIASGMSGSPVYAKGRLDENKNIIEEGVLIGACAYGYSFNNEQGLFGVTPIELMMPILDNLKKSHEENRKKLGQFKKREFLKGENKGKRTIGDVLSEFEGVKTIEGWEELLIRKGKEGEMKEEMDFSKDYLRRLGVELYDGYSGAVGGELIQQDNRSEFINKLQGGSPIASLYLDGDFAVGGVGTVTYVTDVDEEGNRKFLAFGHEKKHLGRCNYIAAVAEVGLVCNAYDSSFKISNTGVSIGVVLEDRISAIGGIIGPEVEAITFKVRANVKNKDTGEVVSWKGNCVKDTRVAEWPSLVLCYKLLSLVGTAKNLTAEVRLSVKFKHYKEFKYHFKVASYEDKNWYNFLHVVSEDLLTKIFETEDGLGEILEMSWDIEYLQDNRVYKILKKDSLEVRYDESDKGKVLRCGVMAKDGYDQMVDFGEFTFNLEELPKGMYTVAVTDYLTLSKIKGVNCDDFGELEGIGDYIENIPANNKIYVYLVKWENVVKKFCNYYESFEQYELLNDLGGVEEGEYYLMPFKVYQKVISVSTDGMVMGVAEKEIQVF